MRNLEIWLIRHTKITEHFHGLVEIQNRDWSYFIKKVIAVTESLNKTDLSEKETKILKKITKNYKIFRRVYKLLYTFAFENFHEFISALDYNKINEINEDVKTNGWALKSITEYSDSFELLNSMDFVYLSGRMPATNGII